MYVMEYGFFEDKELDEEECGWESVEAACLLSPLLIFGFFSALEVLSFRLIACGLRAFLTSCSSATRKSGNYRIYMSNHNEWPVYRYLRWDSSRSLRPWRAPVFSSDPPLLKEAGFEEGQIQPTRTSKQTYISPASIVRGSLYEHCEYISCS